MKQSNGSLEISNPNQMQTNSTSAIQQPKAAPNSDVNKASPDAGEREKPHSLAELFGDSENPDSEEINLSENEPDDPTKPIDSIERLLKRTGLTAEQLYALKIAMPHGGESISIGDLKDRVGELVDFDAKQSEFDERRIAQEGELLRAQSELRELLKILPKEAIDPKVLATLRTREETTVRRERALTLEHIPDWRDERRRLQDSEGMVEMFREYGFSDGFLNSIVDHRALKFARDSFLIRQRIKKSLAAARDAAKKGAHRPSGKTNTPAKNPNKTGQQGTRAKATSSQRDVITNWLNSHD